MRTRNLVFRTLVLVAACFAVPALTSASPADRAVLRDKLSFRYVDQPNNNALSYNPAILDNAIIMSGTESGPFWSHREMSVLQELVRALLRDPANGGDDLLQLYAARIVSIVNKPVIVYLVNDMGSQMTDVAINRWGVCIDEPDSNRAWPCAINMSLSDDGHQECARRSGRPAPVRRDNTWAGSMVLGAWHSVSDDRNIPNRRWTLDTFIHELVHTQDRSDDRGHQFFTDKRSYRYGNDDNHYTQEATPDLAMTYQEGIANTITLLYDAQEARDKFQWFAENGVLIVERPAPGPAQGLPCWTGVTAPSRDIWLYNQLLDLHTQELPAPSPDDWPGYAQYRVRSLPPRFIVHNEFILSLIFSEYVRHIGFDSYIAALRAANSRLFRVSAPSSAVLFDALCSAGLPQGQTAASLAAQAGTIAGPKPYLLPLAYADYFTGYQSTSKAEFAGIFENGLAQAWIDLYWDRYKDGVRSAVRITATPAMTTPRNNIPRREDLTTIATTLGVTQSIRTSPAAQP